MKARVTEDAKPESLKPESLTKSKKKKSSAEIQAEIQSLTRSKGDAPGFDMKKLLIRVGVVLAVVWVIAIILPTRWGLVGAGVVTTIAVVGVVLLIRYMKKNQAIGAILRGADTAEGRQDALKKLETDFKKGDTAATLARAQLEMQEDPRKALASLETVNLEKQMAPVAAQVRAMRAQIHLVLGEVQDAKNLVDQMEIGKQEDAKTRVMFATVASEAWARTGQGRKALDTLELFNPEDPDLVEMKPQIWRARAFAYAAQTDTKGIARSLKKLADMNPQLLGMFVGQKKIHPLLEREAKQLAMRMGIVPKRMMRSPN